MKYQFRFFIFLLLACFFSLHCNAEYQWVVEKHYQYDMRGYFSVVLNGDSLKDVSSFEIAAYCGDECRGVGEIVTLAPGVNVLYISVGSDTEEGDKISFRVHHKTTNRYASGLMPMTFKADDLFSKASEPEYFLLNVGDINGSGSINITDVAILTAMVLGDKEKNMMADVNDDGIVDIKDVEALAALLISKK